MLELKNYAGSSLLVPLAAAGTEAQILTADAAEFPALTIAGDIFRARLRDNAGNYEFVTVTARAGNRLTIERGAEGTTPRDFPAGSSCELVVTAGSWDLMAENRWTRPRDANREVLAPTRLSATSFSLPGNLTALFAPNRALRLHQNAPATGYVASSSYAVGVTTIVVAGCVIDTGLALVELGLEIEAAPKYGNAANADTLNGKTKAEIVAEAQAGTAANASALSGKTKAEIVAEARLGLLSETGSAAGLTNVSDVSARDIAAMGLLIAAIATGRGSSGVPKGGGWFFGSDELAKTGATYDSANKRYVNTVTLGSNLVPVMSSNSQSGFTASASSVYSGSATYEAYRAFDQSDANKWLAAANTGILTIAFSGVGNIGGVTMKTDNEPNRAPRDFTIEVNNGAVWVTVYTASGVTWTANELKQFLFAAQNATALRVVVTGIAGDYVGINGLGVLPVSSVSNMTLAAAAGVSLGFTPTKASIYVLHKSLDALTYNTDVTVGVSRGGNYATASDLAKLCAYDATYDLLKATMDLSAIGAGQTGYWRLDTYNAKQQQVRAALVLFQ
ncbi:MAG: hypothetical protein HY916_09115 [Desulfovibrio sp.]|jgi:hypothetical protein|nr:hypothetical protein [Desulfovibrio sp.]